MDSNLCEALLHKGDQAVCLDNSAMGHVEYLIPLIENAPTVPSGSWAVIPLFVKKFLDHEVPRIDASGRVPRFLPMSRRADAIRSAAANFSEYPDRMNPVSLIFSRFFEHVGQFVHLPLCDTIS